MILGIDPGHERTAIVLVAPDYSIHYADKLLNDSALQVVSEMGHGDSLSDLAIECLQSYGAPVGRETFETAYWIGRFWGAGDNCGKAVHLYPRPKIVRALCGGQCSGDAAVRAALLQRFGGDKKGEPLHCLKGDGSDKRSAYAVAVYHLDGAKLGAW